MKDILELLKKASRADGDKQGDGDEYELCKIPEKEQTRKVI
jgi:hypothetical protein